MATNFKLPPGFEEAEAPAPAPTATMGSPNFDPNQFALPPGFEPSPPPEVAEHGYFKQVKDRVTDLVKTMYDAWDHGDFPTLTGIPQTIMGISEQYTKALPESKTPSEFLLNLIPIFGPVLNRAATHAGQGKPQTSAAELTTDILLPLLAEKIPVAVADLIPSKLKAGMTPEDLMRSALKPTISKKPKIAAASKQAVRTAVQEGIPVSEAGMTKLTTALAQMNARREEIIGGAPKPELVITPKMQRPELPRGGVDFELGPTVPPPGTKQTILSHARGGITAPEGAENMAEFMQGLRESYTGEPADPRAVLVRLEQAKNQQLIEDINRAAQESGLLDALQAQARAANQPVPFDITEAFNFSVKNAIDPHKVAARLDQLKKRYKTTNPEADFATIDAAKEEFLRNYPVPMSYKSAQAVRAATSRKLQDKAYVATANPASVQSQVVLERAIMDELKEALPELKSLNAREHRMLQLEPELQRAIGRTGNWEIWSGIQAATAAALGGTVGPLVGVSPQHSATAAAIVAMALRDPAVKSKLAIALNRAQQLNPNKFGTPSVAGALERINRYHRALERAAAGVLPALTDKDANPDIVQPGSEENQP